MNSRTPEQEQRRQERLALISGDSFTAAAIEIDKFILASELDLPVLDGLAAYFNGLTIGEARAFFLRDLPRAQGKEV